MHLSCFYKSVNVYASAICACAYFFFTSNFVSMPRTPLTYSNELLSAVKENLEISSPKNSGIELKSDKCIQTSIGEHSSKKRSKMIYINAFSLFLFGVVTHYFDNFSHFLFFFVTTVAQYIDNIDTHTHTHRERERQSEREFNAGAQIKNPNNVKVKLHLSYALRCGVAKCKCRKLVEGKSLLAFNLSKISHTNFI